MGPWSVFDKPETASDGRSVRLDSFSGLLLHEFMSDPSDSEATDSDLDQESLLDSINTLYDENREVVEAIELLENEIKEVEDPVGMYVALFDMYNEFENMEEAGTCLIEAARRVGPGSHEDLTYFLYNQLELFSQLNPEAQSAYEKLGHLISQDEGDLGANTLHLDQRKLYQVDLIPEILLANHLHRARVLSDQEYQLALQDLCWCSNKAPLSPRAVLYVLEDRELPHREKAIEFLAHDSSTPYLDLNLIRFDRELIEVLPREFCHRRAACVIGEVGGEPLVAVLNPYNLQLREDVARMIDSEPHFFLTSAAGYQVFLDRQAEVATG